jgi:hypothetical protein
MVIEDARAAYDRRRQELTREIERRVVLSVLDRKWRGHLYEMDYLREGIGLQAMGQRDPLGEYQREACDMFTAMMEGIKEESVGNLFNLQFEVKQNRSRKKPTPGRPRSRRATTRQASDRIRTLTGTPADRPEQKCRHIVLTPETEGAVRVRPKKCHRPFHRRQAPSSPCGSPSHDEADSCRLRRRRRVPEATWLPGMIITNTLFRGDESQHISPRHQAEVDRWDRLHVRDQEEPEKRSRPPRHPQVRPGDRPPR